MVAIGWSRNATIQAMTEALPRAHHVAGQLLDLAELTEGTSVRAPYDFRRLSGKMYAVADSIRDARTAILSGGSHFPARLMLGGALRSVTKFEELVATFTTGLGEG